MGLSDEFPGSLLISLLCTPGFVPTPGSGSVKQVQLILVDKYPWDKLNTRSRLWVGSNRHKPWEWSLGTSGQTGQVVLIPWGQRFGSWSSLVLPGCWFSVTMVTRLLVFKATMELGWGKLKCHKAHCCFQNAAAFLQEMFLGSGKTVGEFPEFWKSLILATFVVSSEEWVSRVLSHPSCDSALYFFHLIFCLIDLWVSFLPFDTLQTQVCSEMRLGSVFSRLHLPFLSGASCTSVLSWIMWLQRMTLVTSPTSSQQYLLAEVRDGEVAGHG